MFLKFSSTAIGRESFIATASFAAVSVDPAGGIPAAARRRPPRRHHRNQRHSTTVEYLASLPSLGCSVSVEAWRTGYS